jgi:hypothetical protein
MVERHVPQGGCEWLNIAADFRSRAFPCYMVVSRFENNPIALARSTLAVIIRREYTEKMARRPMTPSPAGEVRPPLRLVVSARKSGPKGFVWEIVRGDTRPTLVRQSSETFKTLEEAYSRGLAVLERMRGPK